MSSIPINKVLERFQSALDKLAQYGKEEIIQQGRDSSGRVIASIEGKIVSKEIGNIIGAILVADYGLIVDSGVDAKDVPFSGTGGGGRSKYIGALLKWAAIIKPSLSLQERKSFVFATAYTHKKEGIPSKGSYRFSKNGRRTGWIKYGLEDNIDQFEKDLGLIELVSNSIETFIVQSVRA